MPLKRPVTLPQARRWPAAAKRRESFCARMGGMRDKLTGEDAAADPDSPINRALAAWDCDKPALLQRKHVSKGIRPMKITQSKVGAEARNPARKTAAKNPARPKLARIMVTDDKTGEKRIETVPYDFAIKAYIGPYQHDFFVRSEGATLVVSEKSTGLRVGAVPYMKRYATMNDRDSAKAFLAETVQRVGPEKFLAAIKKAPKVI